MRIHESPFWAELLACPDCRAELACANGVVAPCPGCGRTFAMRDGVPLLHPRGAAALAADGAEFFLDAPGRMVALAARHPRLARLAALPDFTSPRVRALP